MFAVAFAAVAAVAVATQSMKVGNQEAPDYATGGEERSLQTAHDNIIVISDINIQGINHTRASIK